MSKANFSDEFTRDAVSQLTERGYPFSEVSERVGVSRKQVSNIVNSHSDISPVP